MSTTVAGYTQIIERAETAAEERAAAVYGRALAWYEIGERRRAIEDWTAYLETPGATAEWRMWAVYNRGFTQCEVREYDRAIADLTAFLAAAKTETAGTIWKAPSGEYSVSVRPLYPEESGCAATAG